MKNSAVLEKVRRICLSLPDTKETDTWGNPHFRVGDKIFCGFGDDAGRCSVGFKLEKAHAAQRVQLPGFSPAAYVGRHGWVSLDASHVKDWDDLREMILESYRLIASKRSLAKLEAGVEAGSTAKSGRRKSATPKTVAKRTAPGSSRKRKRN